MKWLLVSAVAGPLMSCSTPEESGREALMDRIERQVQLPKGAGLIKDYARYYAESGGGEVTAVYLTPIDEIVRPGEPCSEVGENFTSREVPCEPTRASWALPADERRWVENERALPFQCDGGCSQITVTFDKAKSVVKSAFCNGSF
jgi:hypothetical protein